jgi:(R,R)-butanediol dehydrogenase / meso-butanediol dehydrogenase / diacetyl reductase
MRAAYYTGEGTIEVGDAVVEQPAAGQVQVAVSFTGICGTDLHILHGHMDHRVTRPGVIGHEMSGRVVALGSGVDGWSVGDAVTVMPLSWCGSCPVCLAGHEHICRNLDFIGIDSTGSMQNRWNVPAEVLVALPDGLSLRDAALVEPTAVAVHDVGRAELRQGERVVVVGGGPVGLLIALVARARGAEVLVAEVDGFRRDIADGLGFLVLDPLATDLVEYVETWSDGAGAAVAFEVSGTQPGLTAALAALAARGRLVVVGIHAEARQMDLHRVFWRELSIVGARVYRRDDFEAAVGLLDSGVIPADLLISAVEPLGTADRAFARLAAGDGVMKVLVDCQEGA